MKRKIPAHSADKICEKMEVTVMKKLLKICVLLLVLLALLLLYGCEQDENFSQSALDQASN